MSAKIDLALPENHIPNFKITVNGAALDPSKIMIIRRVTGNVYNQGGGGWEVIYKGQIDRSQFSFQILP